MKMTLEYITNNTEKEKHNLRPFANSTPGFGRTLDPITKSFKLCFTYKVFRCASIKHGIRCRYWRYHFYLNGFLFSYFAISSTSQVLSLHESLIIKMSSFADRYLKS